jgi:four helix bundle protein
MEIKSYRDLRVWQAAMELSVRIYRLSQDFPKQETCGLTSQMRPAVITIPSRIAEGHTREHLKDYLHLVGLAQATLAELETQVQLSGRLGYLAEEAVGQTIEQTESLGRQL